MDPVNKTLYIPLYGKAFVSRKGILLSDPMAEKIWSREAFPLKGKSASKWLAYSMAMRSAVFDNWTKEQLEQLRSARVLHIGCGLDSRVQRLGAEENRWYDIDFPEVIRERKKYFREEENYRMLAADMRTSQWKREIPAGGDAVIVMEGVSMYFPAEDLEGLFRELRTHFSRIRLLMDVYSTFGAKASKYKNPINDVGVTTVYGMDDPVALAGKTGLRYVRDHSMTPPDMIAQLSPGERVVFSNLYAGKLAQKIYRLYEYRADQQE